MFLWFLCTPLHVSANCGRSRVKNCCFVFFDNLPDSVICREVRNSLVHNLGRAICQWPINDVAVASNPTNICGAPKNICLWLVIKRILERRRHMRQITGCCMHDAFRFAGCAGCIEQKQQMFCFHWFGFANRICLRHRFVIPDITPWSHRNFIVATLHDHDMFNRFCRLQCFIGLRLQREDFSPTPTAISSYQ